MKSNEANSCGLESRLGEQFRTIVGCVRLALGTERWTWFYLGSTAAILGLVTIGLTDKPSNGIPETFFFGRRVAIGSAQTVYFSIVAFLWFLGLVVLSFTALKPLLKTTRRNFVNFTRFSRKGRATLECVRLGILLRAVSVLAAPFLVAAVVGRLRFDFSSAQTAQLIEATIPGLCFVALWIYVAALLKVPEDCVGLCFLTPLLSYGLQKCVDSISGVGSSVVFTWLPQLPFLFFTPTAECVHREAAKGSLVSATVATLAFVAARLLFTAKTKRLENATEIR